MSINFAGTLHSSLSAAARDWAQTALLGHLERAREYAHRWGSSQHEDTALAMLPE